MKPYLTLIFVLFLFSALSYGQSDSIGDKKIVFEKVEKEAAYPGGETEWRKYLEQNLNANTPVDNGAPIGQFTVFVQFIVDRDGSISEIKPLTNLGYGMEQEVVRIIKKTSTWEPAILHGKPVKAYRKQPVTFVVTEEEFDISTKELYTLFTNTDNELTVDAGKIKPEDLQVTISRGKITSAGNGKYIAWVTGSARVIITVFNTKKNKQIGVVSFEVKRGG